MVLREDLQGSANAFGINQKNATHELSRLAGGHFHLNFCPQRPANVAEAC